MSGNHTPTPWKVSPGHVEGAVTVRQDGGEFQRPVAEVWHNGDDPKANAELIVTAVNSYASSQAEIERLRTLLTDARSYLDGTNPLVMSGGVRNIDLRKRIDAALSGSEP